MIAFSSSSLDEESITSFTLIKTAFQGSFRYSYIKTVLSVTKPNQIFTRRLLKLGGVVLERFHRMRVLAISYFLSGVFTGLLPWCTSLGLLIGVMLANGICMGIVDTGMENYYGTCDYSH